MKSKTRYGLIAAAAISAPSIAGPRNIAPSWRGWAGGLRRGRSRRSAAAASPRRASPAPASIASSSYDSVAVAPAATAAFPPSRKNHFVAHTSKVLVLRSSTTPSRLNRIRGRVACFRLTSRSGAPIKSGTKPHPKSPVLQIGAASLGPRPQSGTFPLAVG